MVHEGEWRRNNVLDSIDCHWSTRSVGCGVGWDVVWDVVWDVWGTRIGERARAYGRERSV